jgi:hypothetical protein
LGKPSYRRKMATSSDAGVGLLSMTKCGITPNNRKPAPK